MDVGGDLLLSVLPFSTPKKLEEKKAKKEGEGKRATEPGWTCSNDCHVASQPPSPLIPRSSQGAESGSEFDATGKIHLLRRNFPSHNALTNSPIKCSSAKQPLRVKQHSRIASLTKGVFTTPSTKVPLPCTTGIRRFAVLRANFCSTSNQLLSHRSGLSLDRNGPDCRSSSAQQLESAGLDRAGEATQAKLNLSRAALAQLDPGVDYWVAA